VQLDALKIYFVNTSSRLNQNIIGGLRWHLSINVQIKMARKYGELLFALKDIPLFASISIGKTKLKIGQIKQSQGLKMGNTILIKMGNTLAQLIDLYIQDGVIGHHKAAKDTIHQLNYFRKHLGSYSLNYINPELLLNQRKKLQERPTEKKTIRVCQKNCVNKLEG
jgi:hypothetical protein